jgi:hypothetical protein
MWPRLPKGHDLTPKVEQGALKNLLCVGIVRSMDGCIKYHVLSVECVHVHT